MGLLFGTLPSRCEYIARGNCGVILCACGGVPVAVTVTGREGRSSRPAVTLKLQLFYWDRVCVCVYRLQGVTEKTGVSVNVNGWECYSYRLLRATALAACPWHITAWGHTTKLLIGYRLAS